LILNLKLEIKIFLKNYGIKGIYKNFKEEL